MIFELALPDFVLTRRKRSSSARRRLKHSSANFVSEMIESWMGKRASTCARRTRRTCEFALEDLRFRGLPFTLARFKEVLSRVLKNVIREQSIHDIFDVPEWRVDVWEEHGDVIGGQARGNPATGDLSLKIAGRRQGLPRRTLLILARQRLPHRVLEELEGVSFGVSD